MKLLIIRHGDPNYAIDSLTEKGWREAEYLAERLKDIPVKAFYVSPLGRAKDTASVTLQKIGREAEECPWLREFDTYIRRPDRPDRTSVCWDWWPAVWTAQEEFFSFDRWHTHPLMEEAGIGEKYRAVVEALDRLLAVHGYERDGFLYRAVHPNNDTIVFFCHFGVECVLLSHLLHIPPMLLWHGFCAAPTSVTTVITEERQEGIAYFRTASFGDISHLYVQGEPPAFSGRFCECYTNDERH